MKLRYITLPAVAAFMAMTSCSDSFLENKPQGSLNSGILSDPDGVEMLVTAAYAGLQGRTNEQGDPWVRPMTNWAYGEVRGDNAYKGGGGTGDIGEMHDMEVFRVQNNNGNCDGRWFNLYSLISRCNKALINLDKVDVAKYPKRDVRRAEVQVLRNFFYFYLVRDFNHVPYMEYDMPENEYIHVRNDVYTRDQHLGRIAGELMDAAAVLPVQNDAVGRINRNIALALAAKVKLYQAYEQDENNHAVVNINKTLLNEVVTIIDQINGYALLDDFQKLDLVQYENGSESVFAMQCSMNDGSADAGRICWANLLNSPGGNAPYHGDGFFLPSQDLINAYQTDANGLPVFDYQSLPDYGVVHFEDETHQTLSNTAPAVDPRLDFVVGRPTITYKTWPGSPCQSWVRERGIYGHNCAKRFWVSAETPDMYPGWPWGASELNWQFIRYADLMLYKAEALIELGTDLEQARTLINDIRKRAKNSAYVQDFASIKAHEADETVPTVDAANYKIGLYPAAGWTQEYARKALRTEMRLEKALEGERFYDLVRWGIAKETMNRYINREKDTRVYYGEASFDTGEEYFPIPLAQYNFTGGIYTQNYGYPEF